MSQEAVSVAPRNDPSISDETPLWRRLIPSWVIPDNNTGKPRITSQAFTDSRDKTPCSVSLSTIVIENGGVVSDLIDKFPGYGIASINAGDARACSQGVYASPYDGEPAHASIEGEKSDKNRKNMSKKAILIIHPDRVLFDAENSKKAMLS